MYNEQLYKIIAFTSGRGWHFYNHQAHLFNSESDKFKLPLSTKLKIVKLQYNNFGYEICALPSEICHWNYWKIILLSQIYVSDQTEHNLETFSNNKFFKILFHINGLVKNSDNLFTIKHSMQHNLHFF